jgi:hypothetical protein
VRGADLEDVLDSVPGLTPGDFVRSVKQLIDLLDQIAGAASSGAAASAAASSGAASSGAASSAAASSGGASSGGAATGAAARHEVAPRDRDVAATARAAIDAMRRGVVAYAVTADLSIASISRAVNGISAYTGRWVTSVRQLAA